MLTKDQAAALLALIKNMTDAHTSAMFNHTAKDHKPFIDAGHQAVDFIESLATRDFVDSSDGENQAVRSFLQLYGTGGTVAIERMYYHLESRGFGAMCPSWTQKERGHLTAGGAQSWIRHMIGFEK